MNIEQRNPLSEFVQEYYQRPGVEKICLELQDSHGLNVCLLLWCIWLEQQSILLTATLLQKAEDTIGHWNNNVVNQLRHVRRTVKTFQMSVTSADISPVITKSKGDLSLLYQQCKDLELRAEFQQLKWLYELVKQENPAKVGLYKGENVRSLLLGKNVPDIEKWCRVLYQSLPRR